MHAAGTGGTANGKDSDASGLGGDASNSVEGVTIVGNNLAVCRISFLNGDKRVVVERQVEW